MDQESKLGDIRLHTGSPSAPGLPRILFRLRHCMYSIHTRFQFCRIIYYDVLNIAFRVAGVMMSGINRTRLQLGSISPRTTLFYNITFFLIFAYDSGLLNRLHCVRKNRLQCITFTKCYRILFLVRIILRVQFTKILEN